MIFNPFSKKRPSNPSSPPIVPDLSEKIETSPILNTVSRPKPIRGPGGKFISKKSASPEKKESKPLEKPAVENKPKNSKTTPETPILKSSSFSGVPIRRFYSQGKWFFVIEDIIPLANVPEVKEYLNLIKSTNLELKENWENMTKKITYNINGQDEFLECADYENILKLISAQDKPLPGPFSRWIRETSQKIPA
jgi:hypothetical protein